MDTVRRPEWKGFQWTCETFWPVEGLLEQVDMDEKKRFVAALKRGELEMPGI